MSLENTLQKLETLANEGDQAISKIRDIAKNSQFLDANSIQMLETQVRASYTERISQVIQTHSTDFNIDEESDSESDSERSQEIAETLSNENESE